MEWVIISVRWCAVLTVSHNGMPTDFFILNEKRLIRFCGSISFVFIAIVGESELTEAKTSKNHQWHGVGFSLWRIIPPTRSWRRKLNICYFSDWKSRIVVIRDFVFRLNFHGAAAQYSSKPPFSITWIYDIFEWNFKSLIAIIQIVNINRILALKFDKFPAIKFTTTEPFI